MLIQIGTVPEIKRGSRVQKLYQNYCVVDIETTGFNPGLDYIFELCAIKVRDGKETDRFISLINPTIPIPPYIEQLTGISTSMVAAAPILKDILPKFIDFVGDDIILGHNITFDLNFITFESTMLLGKPFLNNYIDTLSLSRKVFSTTNHKLITLAKELSLSAPAHRADADCITTKELYDLICKMVNKNNIDIFAKQYSHSKLKASDIKTEKTDFDDGHPYYGKVCVFTGALSFPRRKAMQMVIDVGGINGDSVTKETDFLIVGSTDYIASLKGQKSSKLKKAEKLISEGQDIKILTEQTFLSFL